MVLNILKLLWSFIVKDFLAGILLTTLKDLALKLVEKTPWTVILERFLTRLLVMCLKWVASLNTNNLILSTVNDFLAVLQGTGLKAAVPILDKSDGSSYEKDNRESIDGKPDEALGAGKG